MYTPQIYSGTNVHANMPYCETRMKGLPTSIGVMCIHLPTTPFIYHPIHLPLAWRARLLGEGPCTLDKLRVGSAAVHACRRNLASLDLLDLLGFVIHKCSTAV